MNCSVCGRFCEAGADSSAPFAYGDVYEPPEPEFYCKRCASKEEEHYVAAGWVPDDCAKADWQRRAAARLGLVEAKIIGDAWTWWQDPKEPFPPLYAKSRIATRPPLENEWNEVGVGDSDKEGADDVPA